MYKLLLTAFECDKAAGNMFANYDTLIVLVHKMPMSISPYWNCTIQISLDLSLCSSRTSLFHENFTDCFFPRYSFEKHSDGYKNPLWPVVFVQLSKTNTRGSWYVLLESRLTLSGSGRFLFHMLLFGTKPSPSLLPEIL